MFRLLGKLCTIGVLVTLFPGCQTGIVGDVPNTPEEGGEGGQAEGGEGGQGSIEPACEPDSIRPRLWALTADQYAAAMKAVFGTTVNVSTYPPDFVDLRTGFSNSPEQLFFSEKHLNMFFDNALLAGANLAKEAAKTCLGNTVPDRACIDAYVKSMVVSAFRRPGSGDELSALSAKFLQTLNDSSLAVATEGLAISLAMSPHFLFRQEFGDGSSDTELRRLV
jgi:hypothetical protein